MPSDAKRSPDRGAFDWFGPIPSNPSDDPYQDDKSMLEPQHGDIEGWKTVGPTSAAYAYVISRAVEMDWGKMIDRSWFIAKWYGAPRWKWMVRVYVALLLVGPALAVVGLLLGWFS